MVQRDEWLNGEAYKFKQGVLATASGDARIGTDAGAYRFIRTKNYVYIQNINAGTGKNLVTRVSHLDGSLRMFSYNAELLSLGKNGNTFIGGPRILADGDELIFCGIYENDGVSQPYPYVGYVIRFRLDGTKEFHTYAINDLGYNNWDFNTELEPYLDKVTGNVVYVFSRSSTSTYDPGTNTSTVNFIKRKLIFDRNSNTYQTVVIDEGPKTRQWAGATPGGNINGGAVEFLSQPNFGIDFHHAHSAFVVYSAAVTDATSGAELLPAYIKVLDPGTSNTILEVPFSDGGDRRTQQDTSWLPPWDIEDQIRRGKSFVAVRGFHVSVTAAESVTGKAYSTMKMDYVAIDCYNNATYLHTQIPYSSIENEGYRNPLPLAIDEANNVYVRVYRKRFTTYWELYETLAKYNSLGVLMWEIETPGLGVTTGKIPPLFFANQSKIQIGKEWIYMVDTATGEALFDTDDRALSITASTFSSYGQVIMMDVYNSDTLLWEPRLLLEAYGANIVKPMEWTTLWMADAVGTLLLTYQDSLGVPKPSNVSARTFIDGVETTIYTGGYRFIEPFAFRATASQVGYIVHNQYHDITLIQDQTLVIIIEPISFDNRNTYELRTPQDILDMRSRDDNLGIYHMMNDIDMAGVTYLAAFGDESRPFMGDFYGNDFTILNLHITRENHYWYNSLHIGFLAACKNAIVENISFVNCSIDGTGATGATGILAGRFENAKLANATTARPCKLHNIFLENCSVITATGNGAGVAVGRLTPDTAFSPDPAVFNIVVKSSTMNILSGRNFGGAIGYFSSYGTDDAILTLENVYAEVDVTIPASVAVRTLGGAIGVLYLNTFSIVNKIACKMKVSAGTLETVGLFGELYCYAYQADLSNLGCDMELLSTPTADAGGIAGYAALGSYDPVLVMTIDKVYSALKSPGTGITSDVIIGELSLNYNTETIIVTNAYHDVEINTFSNIRGSAGRTTAEMKSKANYVDWDFINVWDIKEGIEYPTLLLASDPPTSIELAFFEDEGLGLTDLEIRLSTFKRMKAIATFPDLTTKDVSASIAIAADPANLTTITGNKIKAVGVGFAQLSVSYNRYTEYGFAELYGPDQVVVTSPNGIVLTSGKKLRLKSKANFRDGYIQDTSLLSEWVSDAPSIISVSADGVVEALSGGVAGISNTYFGITGYLALSVSSMGPPVISRIDTESATAYVYFTLIDPVNDITYFKATAYLEETLTTVLDAVDVTTKPENFMVSRDKGISWSQVPAAGTVPSENGEDIYCVKLFIGPRTTAWVEVGAALIEGAGGGTGPSNDDVTAPIVTVVPVTGLFSTDQSITITTDEPADVYYTLDETTPTVNSTKYTVPIAITNDTILTYFAVDALDNPTYVLTETYAFNRVLPVVSSNLSSGNYTGAQAVLLETTKGDIYYTVDGTEPSASSTLYTSAVIVPEEATTVLKFLAIDAYGNVSETLTMTYIVAASPLGSSFGKPILITAPGSALATANALMRDVYFLIDGLTVGASYIVETANPDAANTYIDSRLWIYNTSQVQLAYDDDAAATQGLSKITFTAGETSIYAMVDDYGDNQDINFQLTIVAV